MANPTDPQALYNMLKAVETFTDELRTNTRIIQNAYSMCSSILGNDSLQYKYVSKLDDVIAKLMQACNKAEDFKKDLTEEYVQAKNLLDL